MTKLHQLKITKKQFDEFIVTKNISLTVVEKNYELLENTPVELIVSNENGNVYNLDGSIKRIETVVVNSERNNALKLIKIDLEVKEVVDDENI